MVLVMFWERQYFVRSLASFSVNAHSLRHVADKRSSFICLLILADNTSTTAFGVCLHLSTTHAVYVCLDVICLDTLISSRLSSGYFQLLVG